MQNKILFILGDGVYPHKTGGMEVFNYYLIQELRQYFDVRYYSKYSLNYGGCTHHSKVSLRPVKFTFPLQLFWHFLTHPSEKNIIISFSSAHWFIWRMYALLICLFNLRSTCVIHYGKTVPQEHPNAYKRFFNAQKTVVAVSYDIKRNYDRAFGTDCIVIPPLVPFEQSTLTKEQCREKYGVPQDANIICMVGSIKGMKNPDTLIDSISAMSVDELAKYKPFALYAGDGGMIDELQLKAREYGIADRVMFLGNVPKDEVNTVMKAADIYLIASDFEGTSVSLLEAMYNQCAIITSRAPGLVDMVRENVDALMFKIRNAEELKDCITNILDNPDKAKQRAESAYNHYTELYSYDNMLQSYIKLFS